MPTLLPKRCRAEERRLALPPRLAICPRFRQASLVQKVSQQVSMVSVCFGLGCFFFFFPLNAGSYTAHSFLYEIILKERFPSVLREAKK